MARFFTVSDISISSAMSVLSSLMELIVGRTSQFMRKFDSDVGVIRKSMKYSLRPSCREALGALGCGRPNSCAGSSPIPPGVEAALLSGIPFFGIAVRSSIEKIFMFTVLEPQLEVCSDHLIASSAAIKLFCSHPPTNQFNLKCGKTIRKNLLNYF